MKIPRMTRGTEIFADLGGRLVVGSQRNKWIMSQGPVRAKLDSWFWRGVNARKRSLHKVTDETQDGQWISRMKQNSSYQKFAKESRRYDGEMQSIRQEVFKMFSPKASTVLQIRDYFPD